ncbi:MAG: hypothetical protein WAL95_01230 [Candidatus Acidiferrales bacterium]
MKGLRGYAHVAVLLLGLLSSTVVPIAAHADSITGRFTLTSEAHWGRTVLPPGEYTYSISAEDVMPMVIVRSAKGDIGAFIFPTSISDARKGEMDNLVLEKTNDGMVVTSLYVKDKGVVLHYRMPKAMIETAAKAPEPKLAASLQAK